MGRPIPNIEGRKFNRLTALKLSERKYSNGARIWECICDCGNKIEVGYSDLVRGETKSCGCYRKEKTSLPKSEASFNILYRNYKNGAKNRDLDFLLDKDAFRSLTEKECYYCGRTPNQIQARGKERVNGEYIYNGIDRVNNFIGYTIENTVPCCKVCNFAKRNMTEGEFLDWIKSVYEYRQLGV